MTSNPRTPVLVGVGQVVRFWDGSDAATAPSPHRLRVDAATAALADTGQAAAVAAAIDRVLVVRTMLDSVPGAEQPFGRSANPPGALARALGLGSPRCIYSKVGGDQPQALVNEAAEAVFAGDAAAVLIAGSEATAAMKQALRSGVTLDWSDDADLPECEDRGLGATLLSKYEVVNGLGAPTTTYPVFEEALRARLGNTPAAHRALMSELWAGFSQVAARNPYAQFPVARSADYLSTETAENYRIAGPYLKWDVAQDAVNQAAAVIVTTAERADALGIDPARRIYLHGYAQVADKLVSERGDLSRSRAMELTLARALEVAGRTTDEIDLFDLYSCFPCAVLLAAEALGLDWRAKPATVTGGLPFFGGPGNSYSLHAIASMAEQLRAAPEAYGLVLANGGFLSKEAVGIYSARPVADWQPVSSQTLDAAIAAMPAPPLLNAAAHGTVESYTVVYRKGQPHAGSVIVRTPEGRAVAMVRSDDAATIAALTQGDPIGRPVAVVHADGRNTAKLTG